MARRITFVTTELARGGAETQIFRVARALARRGHTVDVISLFVPRAYADELEAAGVGVHHLPAGLPRIGRGMGIGFGRLVARLRPDVLVGFLFHANLLVRTHGRALGVPGIITSIRSDTFGPRIREVTERAFQGLRLDELVVTNSARVGASLVQRGIVDVGHVQTVGNAICVDDYGNMDASSRLASRSELGLKPDAFAWLSVANFREVKDHPTMLSAFARALEGRSDRDQRLLLVGAGEPGFDFEARVNELGIVDRVVRLGVRDDVPALMQSVDGFVLTSRHEGLPNVVMEALAAGLPVVSTDVGGVRELVDDGRSGHVLSPGDAAGLGAAMAKIMALDEPDRREMGRLGRAHMATVYDLEVITSRWEALVERAYAVGRQRTVAWRGRGLL